MKIKVTADSICDLSPELLKDYDIPLAPLSVLVDEAEYHDGVDITPDQIFAAVDSGKHVHSAAVNVAEYEELFRRIRKDYDAVIHFTIGTTFSACYTNACTAAEMVGNVWVVNSDNLTTGTGHLVLDACDMVKAGMEPDAIVEAVKKTIPNIDTSFVVSTIDYLYKGGRVTGMAAVGAKLLNIHPTIELANGIMQPGKKYRGNMHRVLEHYIEERLADPSDIDTSRVFISHSYAHDPETVQLVHAKVAELLPNAKIYETIVGGTISVHCGPGTLGIVLKRKSAKK